MRSALLPIAAALATTACGCAGPTYTVAELGQPVFAPVVSAEARYERADPKQTGGLDAFPGTADTDADHRMGLTFWPGSTPQRVGIEVKARARGKLPLSRVAAAVYPVSHAEAQRFARTGALPDPAAAPLAMSAESEVDEAGWRVLALVFERSALPAGTAFLAVPVLSEFKDGWIHISYYKTLVPEPMKVLTPAEVEQFEARRRAAQNASHPADADEAQPDESGSPEADDGGSSEEEGAPPSR